MTSLQAAFPFSYAKLEPQSMEHAGSGLHGSSPWRSPESTSVSVCGVRALTRGSLAHTHAHARGRRQAPPAAAAPVVLPRKESTHSPGRRSSPGPELLLHPPRALELELALALRRGHAQVPHVLGHFAPTYGLRWLQEPWLQPIAGSRVSARAQWLLLLGTRIPKAQNGYGRAGNPAATQSHANHRSCLKLEHRHCQASHFNVKYPWASEKKKQKNAKPWLVPQPVVSSCKFTYF